MKKIVLGLMFVCSFFVMNVKAEGEGGVGSTAGIPTIKMPETLFVGKEEVISFDETEGFVKDLTNFKSFYQYRALTEEEVKEYMKEVELDQKVYNKYYEAENKASQCQSLDVSTEEYTTCNNELQQLEEELNLLRNQYSSINVTWNFDDSKWIEAVDNKFKVSLENEEEQYVILYLKYSSDQGVDIKYKVYSSEKQESQQKQESVNSEKNPNTGDNISYILMGFGIVTLIGIISVKKYKLLKNN